MPTVTLAAVVGALSVIGAVLYWRNGFMHDPSRHLGPVRDTLESRLKGAVDAVKAAGRGERVRDRVFSIGVRPL